MVRAVGETISNQRLVSKLDTVYKQTHLQRHWDANNAVINGSGSANSNRYYRRVQVANLM